MDDKSKKRWLALWKRIGAKGGQNIYSNLAVRYAEPHRFYHTLAHVEHCLDEFEKVRHLAEDPDAVGVAIWFHDAVYNTRQNDNEEKSAELALKVLMAALLPDSFCQKVANLIIATKHINLSADQDVQLLLDIDLSILGQPEEKFVEYERNIRMEYGWVPDELFAQGRSAILIAFLYNRPTVYSTEFFRNIYEAQARKNIMGSLEKMGFKK